MKTYLIQLQKFDNLPSTLEKMRRAKTARILIIFPKRGNPQLSMPDLELIKRQASSIGAEVAFVCRNLEVIETAKDKSIPIFSSVTQAESTHWGIPEWKFEKRISVSKNLAPFVKKEEINDVKNRTLGFLIKWLSVSLAGAAIFALLIFFLPSATIIIYPELTNREININIWASPKVTSVNINGSLPAQVQVISMSQTATAQSSGKTGLPSEKATGSVVFRNISNQAVTIPVGSVLIADNENKVEFKTLTQIVLNPGATSTQIDIEAINPGVKGNVNVGIVTTIEGSLAGLVEVTNDSPTEGGEDVEAPSPSEEDYLLLKEKMLSDLEQQALDQFDQSGIILLPSTMDEGTITSQIRSVDPGTASDTFSLTINVDFRVLSYSEKNFETLTESAMLASLIGEAVIYQNSVTSKNTSQPTGNLEDGVRWTVQVSAQTIDSINEGELIEMVSGETITDCRAIIDANYPSRQTVEINTFPKNMGRMPWLGLNTRIEIR